MTSEQTIQNKIIKRYEIDGYFVIKLSKTNKNGIPDLICLKPNEVLFIEVKRPGKRPSPLQIYMRNLLKKIGFKVLILSE